MRRRDHLRSVSGLALAAMLALAPQPALAQAFQGSETVTLGNAIRSIVTTGVENIAVSTPQAIINWAPNDTGVGGAPIDFLPAGNIVNFSSPVGLPYTVLNRVIAVDPARAIALNGAVNSDAIGNIWFYAPGGLLLGGSAQFNVGGLLLTANDPVPGTGGNFIGAANDFRLAAAAGSTAGVTISAGAQIASNSYMIAVAPRITMAGAATVGTSAALVMAEDVSFTLNGGLFDITANIGTAAGGTSTVSGSITGPGGISGQGVFSRIYMMAVPRNDAMTLLITGGAQLGFDVASAADIDGNAIILSGAHDIVAIPFVSGTSQFVDAPVAGSNAAATINVEAATLTSSLVALSKDTAQVVAATGSITAAGNIEVFADGQALIGATSGQTLQAAGRLVADASTRAPGQLGQSRTAGVAEVAARAGGRVIAGGDIVAAAVGFGDAAFSPGQPGGSGTGGSARILAEGSGSELQGIFLIADASGRAGPVFDGDGGSGIGGTAEVRFDAGTLVSVASDIGVFATGSGDVGSDGRAAGDALGGTALFTLGNGVALDLLGAFLTVSADADYGEGGFTNHLGGGTVQGGTATLTLGDGATLQAGFGTVSATAFGAFGTGLNDFIGGNASVVLNDVGGTTALTLDTLGIVANGEAGVGSAFTVIDGGTGTGGSAGLLVAGNGQVASVGPVTIAADGLGGDGADVSGGFIGIAGAGTGGTALVDFAGGGLVVGDALLVSAQGTGGRGDVGGAGQGGQAGVALGPGSLPNDPGIVAGTTLTITARAEGGSATQGAAGNAQGGQAGLLVESGAVAAAALVMDVLARGGDGVASGSSGATGGDGLGGDIELTRDGGTLNVAGPITLEAFGLGGSGVSGGNGVAGQVAINIGAGNSLLLGSGLLIDLGAAGGSGQSGPGGDGIGGSLLLSALAGGLIESSGPLLLDVAGFGGTSNAGAGGAGLGGTLGITADGTGSIVRLAGATLAASGIGGTGIAEGAGSGGAVILTASNSGLIDVTAPLAITAQGSDGAGTPGAAGVVQVLALGGGTMTLDTLDAQAIGTAPIGSRSALVANAGSSITIAGDGLLAASGDIGLNDGGSISAGGTLRIATPGQILAGLASPAPGATGTVAAGLLELLGDGGVDLATGTAGSADVVIASNAGSVRMGSVGATATAQIDSAADVAIAGASAVDGALVITAGGAVALAGSVASPDIAITSADLALSPGVTLGGASAQRIFLSANGAVTSMLVGGAGSSGSGVYSLSNAEFGSLRARSIAVEMPNGPMTVEALALPAIAPAGSEDGIFLFSAGPLRVTGAVTMAQAGAGNRLFLTSETRIEVVQGSGSILIGADADTPAGELELSAESIRIASDPLLNQIADGSLAGAARDNALNAAAAVNNPGGSIAAGSIGLAAVSDLLVQNSGSAAIPAGFTAGSGGLVVSAVGNGSLDMVINGRIARTTGGFATGAGALALVQYQPDINAMAASSQVNGCNIFSLCPAQSPLQDAIITLYASIDPLTPDEVRDRAGRQATTPALPLQMIQTLFDFSPLFRDVDATDPATSTGNPALWRDPGPASSSGGQE